VTDPVNAVVLGGSGAVDERLARIYQGPTEGLIELAGLPAVQYLLEALRASPAIHRIALAGPPALLEHAGAALADVRLAEAETIVDKLSAAALNDGRKLLMATCDIPLVTPEVIADLDRQEDLPMLEAWLARQEAR
jgi:molybdopterin-guanine dinucleotide biosynthesis protein A